MEYSDIKAEISELEKEISLLPSGSIAVKRQGDKEYYYHRTSHDGKRTESDDRDAAEKARQRAACGSWRSRAA